MQVNYAPFGKRVIWMNFKECTIGMSITKMNVSVTFHMSFFSRNHYYIRVKNILPFLLLTLSNFFCLIKYCFSNNPQIFTNGDHFISEYNFGYSQWNKRDPLLSVRSSISQCTVNPFLPTLFDSSYIYPQDGVWNR